MIFKKTKKPFTKGDIVMVTDNDQVYYNYSQFVKRHPQFAVRWAYKVFPNPTNDKFYNVLGCYKHVLPDRYDRNEWCVVIQSEASKQIFLIGERGLKSYTPDKK